MTHGRREADLSVQIRRISSIYTKIKNQFRELEWQRIPGPGAKTRFLMTEIPPDADSRLDLQSGEP